MKRLVLLLASGALLAGCSSALPPPQEPSAGHIRPDPTPAAPADIPDPVSQVPILPEPSPAPKLETYTVVVSDVPVRELLFALARDASLNVDIHQDIAGSVTLNAVDQTLPQILERLSRQVDLRYEMSDNQLVVMPDSPYLKTYKVDYVNLARTSSSDVQLSTEIASVGDSGSGSGGGGGGGRSGSSTQVDNESNHTFWETLETNIQSMLGKGSGDEEIVISNRESGVLTVRATEVQHRQIQEYIDRVVASVSRQVLIEATIVEVELNDEYQSGVDWSKVAIGEGLTVLSGAAGIASPVGGALATTAFGAANNIPSFLLDFQSKDDRNDGITFTVSLLKEFGNAKVLSSPKLMALNNQTAVLKVVENIVYFEIDRDTSQSEASTVTTEESNILTVPVGLVMHVTPQISESDNVILNVRPTISRVTQFVADPLNANNLVPQVAVREMDSVLKVPSGRIAVLGGLMQDEDRRTSSGLPGLPDNGGLGEAFKHRRNQVTKSELVIFMRPLVVHEADIEKDLREFRPFLEQAYRLPSVSSATTGSRP
ncbi:MAG: secretin N-terminal domain-containing protein [Gammaproteobacteria bacterium]|nr:secretin N-terminal domain-containing protein [Gammaproteobacteria bacterium]